jgi:hypothetical protein
MDRYKRRFRRAARKSVKYACRGEYFANCARLEEFMGSEEVFEKKATEFIRHLEEFAVRSSDYPPEGTERERGKED